MPGPAKDPSAKRNNPDWKNCTYQFRLKTVSRLKTYEHLIGLLPDGIQKDFPADKAEIIDLAVNQYLDEKIPLIDVR